MIDVREIKQSTNESYVIDTLIHLDDAYYNGEELISDAAYDEIRKDAQNKWPNNSYFKNVGAMVRGHEIKHTHPIGSLDQYHEGELCKWIDKHGQKPYTVSEKLDGASLTLTFVGGKLKFAATRGDGFIGKDITRHAINIENIPKIISTKSVVDIRGEAIIKKQNEAIIKELLLQTKGREYKNLRNIVNGLLNAEEIPEIIYPYIDFVAYDIVDSLENKNTQFETLDKLGFDIPVFVSILPVFNSELSENNLTSLLNAWRNSSIYEIDGVVVEFTESKDRVDLFPTDTDVNPGYAFKWKVGAEDNRAFSPVIDVEWNVTKDNFIKPVVLIEPVDLVGVTIQRLSGFNAKFIQDNGIGVGAIVEFTRSGDVIPHILSVPTKVEPKLPDIDWVWSETKVDAIATEDNIESHLLKLTFFFSALEIDSLKDASIKKLVDAGHETIEDIIQLSKDNFENILGKNGIKAFDSLHSKLNNVKLYQLMGAYPYIGRGFGERRSKALLAGVSDWKTCSLEDIINIEGFETKTAELFLSNRQKFIDFLEKLNKYITFIEDVKIEGNLSGKSFAFTGIRLKDAEAKIISLGGEIHDGVKKGTTYLVAKDPNASSGKLDKARKQGTQVIGIAELENLLN